MSFLVLKGKCRYCQKPINSSILLIEIFSGLIFALSFWAFYSISIWIFFFSLILWSIVLIIFFYDLEKKLIPDPLILFLLFLFIFKFFLKFEPNFYSALNYKEALLGAAFLFLFFYLINYFSQGVFMGLGDAKIAIFFGLFLGLKYSLIFLWLSFLVGGLVAFFLLILKLKKRKDEIALAPFLIFTFFLFYFFPQIREFFSNFLW